MARKPDNQISPTEKIKFRRTEQTQINQKIKQWKEQSLVSDSLAVEAAVSTVRIVTWWVSQAERERKRARDVPVGSLAGGGYRCEPSPRLRFIKVPRFHGWGQAEAVEISAPPLTGRQKKRCRSITKTGAETAPSPPWQPFTQDQS